MAYVKKDWQDLPSQTTPVTADDLDRIENGIENNDKRLNGTSPAGEMIVDSIRTKNMFDGSSFVAGDRANQQFNPTQRVSSRQALYLDEGTYTLSTNLDTTNYKYAVQTTATPPPLINYNYLWDSGYKTSNFTFTINSSKKGYFNLLVAAADGTSTLTVDAVKSFNWQLEKNSSATSYMPYQELNNNIVDTGWLLASLTSNFKNYQDNTGNAPQYRKIGDIVCVRGTIATTSSLSSSTEQTIFTLPEGYRPTREVRKICQGSGMNRWLFTINTNGVVAMSRYGISTQDNVETNQWLPFNVTFMI